jgi:hypothetical protein
VALRQPRIQLAVAGSLWRTACLNLPSRDEGPVRDRAEAVEFARPPRLWRRCSNGASLLTMLDRGALRRAGDRV